MATKRVIPDADFGQIIIRTRITARNISMRTKPDGLHVTVPPRCLTSKVLAVIEEFRPRLLEKWEKITPQPLNLDFRIDAPCFRLHIEQGRYSRFTLRTDEDLRRNTHAVLDQANKKRLYLPRLGNEQFGNQCNLQRRWQLHQ